MVGLTKVAYAGVFLSMAVAFQPAVAQSDPTSLQPGRSRIETIEITKRISPAFGGKSFGTVGQYELLVGRAHGFADPRSVRNAGVVYLDRVPTNADGLVGYSFDIMILKPIDLSKTNGTLVFEVSNRGRPLLHTSLLNGDGDFDKTSGAGSTFILQQGYMLAWTGWQADLGGSEGGDLAADYPVATDGDRSITGWVRDELAIDGSSGAQVATVPANATAFEAPLYYPLAQPDRPQLKVSVRERADDTPQQLPPDQIKVTGPKSVQIKLAEGFDRGALYSVEYEAKDPKVLGLSFVSMRDFISLLRYGSGGVHGASNPLAVAGRSAVARTIAIGLSQSGRYQRDFLYQDFNVDEAGRRVFDGMIPQGAGAKRGFFNARFAEPGRSPDLQHEMRGYPGATFPFTYGDQIDLVTRRTDGILSRCRRSDSCPKVMQLDSDWEQWQQAASLVVTDEIGRPIRLPDNVRAYMVAGVPHATLPPHAGIATPQDMLRRICEQRMNPLTWAPVLRALVFDMNAWIADGTEPPPSRYPASASEGRVSIDALRNMYPTIPGAPFSPAIGKLQLVDFTANPPRPISAFAPYAIGVMAVNGDGNAEHGVVLPEVAVPIATYSGRNTRAKGYAQGELCGTLGSSIPFARTAAERRDAGDPRLSIEERYKDENDYRDKLTSAARQLVADRLMLKEDADSYASYSLPK